MYKILITAHSLVNNNQKWENFLIKKITENAKKTLDKNTIALEGLFRRELGGEPVGFCKVLFPQQVDHLLQSVGNNIQVCTIRQFGTRQALHMYWR